MVGGKGTGLREGGPRGSSPLYGAVEIEGRAAGGGGGTREAGDVRHWFRAGRRLGRGG